MKLDRKILPFMYLYARIHKVIRFCCRRSVAQLVERRSPKPKVAGSIPSTPASLGYKGKFKSMAKANPIQF